VVVMVVAFENRCGYCVAMHSAGMTRAGAGPDLLDALRAGGPLPDARLEGLAAFTRALLRGRGDVPEEEWRRFREAGFDHAAALEVVLGVATYTLSTFANRLTQAPLDRQFEAFRWSGAARARRAESAGKGGEDLTE
jgi:AhpD family alkylhydroperoxidase